jgi:hypothetical protein
VQKINEYVHKDGQSQGAVVGTEMDKILAKDEAWTLQGAAPVVATPEPKAAEDAGGESGESVDVGSGDADLKETGEIDLAELTRSQLNALAAERGLKGAEELPNKPAVIEALRKAAEDAGGESGE